MLSGYVVHGVEGDGSRLCGSSKKDSHEISQSVKAANLARYFPPWTEMTRPAISGVAIDTLLFSRIRLPLFHRYRIVSHTAFVNIYETIACLSGGNG